MKISIVLATYNGEYYLSEQLDSFLNQTLLPDEIIISDDCSTDKTFEIVRKFANRAPFKVKYWENVQNVGYGANFSKAMMVAQGDLVFLSDQDDVWYPKKIETMVKFSIQYPNYYVYMCDVSITDENLISTGLTKLGQLKSGGFSDESFVMGAASMIRKDFLNKCLPLPVSMIAHDSWIIGIAGTLGKKIIINEVLQFYRRHLNNTSHAIINSTVRVSRFRIFMLKTIESFNHRNTSTFGEYISEIETEINSLENVSAKFQDIEYKIIKDSIEKKYKYLYLMKKREKLRSFPIVQRVKGVLKMWAQGDYKDFLGLKSIFRDIVG